MSSISRSEATLRIMGDDLDPQAITELLGHAPTHAHRKGEVVRSGNGTRVAPFGYWRLHAETAVPEDLDQQVAGLLSSLTQELDAWRSIAGRYRIDMFCGLFMQSYNDGIGLSPSTLLALGARGIQLDLDVYASSADA